jgi:hypothetical protein
MVDSENVEKRKAAIRIISTFWLSYRDRQIFQILKSVLNISDGKHGSLLLQRLSPNEFKLFNQENVKINLKLAGNTFPPKVVFKVYLQNSSINYLNGRNEIRNDIEGSIKMMGERNFYGQLTSDLIERKLNKNVTDLVDIGTNQDKIRFANYQENSHARIGGKDNGWRSVDLTNLPRAAPVRDLFEVIKNKTISALPRKFWTLPKNCAHFEKQVMLMLENDTPLSIPKPIQKKTIKDKRTKKGEARVSEMSELYSNSELDSRPYSLDREQPKDLAIISIQTDDEARELYEWSQFL